jgi:twitching motility protein PilT
MAKIDQLFTMMQQQGASDLHLSTGAPPTFRLNGEMVKLKSPELTAEQCKALIFEILNEKQIKLFTDNWELDCSYSLEGVGRFRVNVFQQRLGMGAVFRIIPTKIKTVQELKLPDSILDILSVNKGLILVTGATGSGKSTTLAALIHHINATETGHILTIEDPIEFVHPSIKCLINQREVSNNTQSFAAALKAALREDPDIILVGEMRDLETIALAMTAAETGHLVFGTLHTSSAPKTVDRIIDVFPQEQQSQVRVMLSESLRAVVAQSLLPTIDGKGRVACIEVLINTHAVGNLIREGKTFQIPSVMQTGRKDGMITFEMYSNDLVKRGLISQATCDAFNGKKVTTPAPVQTPAVNTSNSNPGGAPQQTQKAQNPAPRQTVAAQGQTSKTATPNPTVAIPLGPPNSASTAPAASPSESPVLKPQTIAPIPAPTSGVSAVPPSTNTGMKSVPPLVKKLG